MAAHTPWSGATDDKLYVSSGQFSLTLKASLQVGSIDLIPTDISWDGVDTPWCGDEAQKLYLQSAQFTSTIKTSREVGSIDNSVVGISWDGVDTPWVGIEADKLYVQYGQFTSSLKTSREVGHIDGTPTGVSYDGANSPWSGFDDDKLYLQSGQFDSTVKFSLEIGSIDEWAHSVSWDGVNSPWCGSYDQKLYLQSAQFTSAIKFSLIISSIDTLPTGIETNDVVNRLTKPIRRPTSTLNFSQVVQTLQIHQHTLQSPINFVSHGTDDATYVSASNTLNLAQNIVTFLVELESVPVATTINFVSEAEWSSEFIHALSSEMSLSQQLEWQGPKYQYIFAYLTSLEQVVDNYLGCPWLPVVFEDDLSLVSAVYRGIPISANSTLNMTQEAYRSSTPISTMSLGQTLGWGKYKGIPPTEMNLVSIADFNGIWNRALEHTSVVGHALTYYIDSACGRKQYTPFIGESTVSNSPSPPSTSESTIQNDPTLTRFKLKYPALAAPSDELELRAPELDNIERLAFNRLNRETRGGKLTVFADPNWPQTQTLITTFIGLTRTEIDDLLTFFTAHIGEEIGLQDWEGREWIGVITTPNESAVQDGKSCTGRGWTITFEFEGVLVESYIPGDQMNLGDSLNLIMDRQREPVHTLNLIQTAIYLVV